MGSAQARKTEWLAEKDITAGGKNADKWKENLEIIKALTQDEIIKAAERVVAKGDKYPRDAGILFSIKIENETVERKASFLDILSELPVAWDYTWDTDLKKRCEQVGIQTSEALAEDMVRALEDAVEVSFTLERDLEGFLAQNLQQLESGLKLHQFNGKPGRQLQTPVGILDLLCEDSDGRLVVVELKAGLARDAALGQICGYVGWIQKNIAERKSVRGILVAQDFTDRVRSGAAGVGLTLLRYRVNFSFESCNA